MRIHARNIYGWDDDDDLVRRAKRVHFILQCRQSPGYAFRILHQALSARARLIGWSGRREQGGQN